MNKENVMKALALCNSHSGDACTKCPYAGTNNCYIQMTNDAIALLQSNDTKPTYHTAIIYTKRDNLSKWFDINGYKYAQGANMEYSDTYQRMRAVYATEREIQLILLVRHEENKCICRIKCPINPLPIKGEFQCVSTSEMTKLLASMGWKYKEKLPLGLFK